MIKIWSTKYEYEFEKAMYRKTYKYLFFNQFTNKLVFN